MISEHQQRNVYKPVLMNSVEWALDASYVFYGEFGPSSCEWMIPGTWNDD